MFGTVILSLSIALLVYIFLSIIIKWKNLCKDENKIYVCADCNQAVIEPTFICPICKIEKKVKHWYVYDIKRSRVNIIKGVIIEIEK